MTDWQAIRDELVGVIEARAKDLLAKNPDAKAFLVERGERLAQLAALYTTSDATGRARVEEQLGDVKQSIENELSGIALDAAAEARAGFLQIVNTAVSTLVQVLPKVIPAL